MWGEKRINKKCVSDEDIVGSVIIFSFGLVFWVAFKVWEYMWFIFIVSLFVGIWRSVGLVGLLGIDTLGEF